MRYVRFGVFGVVAAIACCAPVQAALYAVPVSGDTVFRVDHTTGEVLSSVSVGSVAGGNVLGFNGLARDPLTGDFWALVRLSNLPSTERRLIKVNPTTGATVDVGNTGDRFASLAFGCDGTLYAVTGDGAATPETLFTLSKTDGTPTFLVELGNGSDGEAIAFNPADGLIYHASGIGTPNSGEIFETINPVTLAVTGIGLAGHDYSEILALTLSSTGGSFLATDLNDDLFTISTSGFVSSPTGFFETGPIKGLAFDSDQCPFSTTTTTSSTTTTTLPPPPCAPTPAVCIPAGKVAVSISEKVAGKEKFKAVLKNLVPALAQFDFGNPVGGTTRYAVCTYDETDALVATMVVDRAGLACGTTACWRPISTRGYKYGDATVSADGVQKIVGKGGDAGKGSIQASGKNNAAKGQSFLPTGITAALAGDSKATVQILTSDAACFGGTATNVRKADGVTFKAKMP